MAKPSSDLHFDLFPLPDLRDLQHREQRQRAEGLEEALLDHQGTIGQFRDLVIGLQT